MSKPTQDQSERIFDLELQVEDLQNQLSQERQAREQAEQHAKDSARYQHQAWERMRETEKRAQLALDACEESHHGCSCTKILFNGR